MYEGGFEHFGAIPQSDMYQGGLETYSAIPQSNMYQGGSETFGAGQPGESGLALVAGAESYEDLVQFAGTGGDTGGRSVFPVDLQNVEPESEPVEHALVISLESAFLMTSGGAPGFILVTGATENAVGVKSLQMILQKTGTDYTVSRFHRPLFKFGDGVSLRASSKVPLKTSALGG